MADNNTKFTKGITVKENSLTPKEIEIIPGGTADTKTTVQGSQTVDRTITLPDANDTLVGKATVDILTNKTIDANGTGNSISNLEVADLAAGVLNTSTTLTGATDLQIPSALAAKSYIDAHINDATDAHDASAISVIPSGNLTSTDVQSALVELQTEISSATGGLSDHITDPTGAHAASAISVSPTGNLGSTEVQAALVELQLDIDTNSTNIANHITDTIDAHDASAISVVPTGNLAADDVQEALVELQTDVDTRATTTALTNHTSASSGVHGVTGSVVGTTDTQVLTNKDIDGGTASNTSRITLPKAAKSTLDALTRKEGTVVYASDEDKVYYDDGTVLKPVGSGSGTINFITNPDGSTGTTGWTEGSFTAAARPSGNFTASSGAGTFTISTTTTTPLGTGTTSFLLTKSSGASRQGRAVVSDFVLPLDYRAKVLKIDVNYIVNSGTFVAGSNTTDSSLIWYAAFSTDNGSTYTVAEPSSFKLLSNSTTISDRFSGSIQTPYNATNMRLIAYVAETANSAWVVECITSVSPSQYVYGTPITDWQSYTPNVGNLVLNPTGKTDPVGYWRRVGDSVEVKVSFKNGSGGTATGTSYVGVSLPAGLIADTNKDLPQMGGHRVSGYGSLFSTISKVYFSGSALYLWKEGVDYYSVSDITANATYSIYASVPILGWSSSVQVSDGYDGRVVAAKYNTIAARTLSSPAATIIYENLVFDTTNSYNTTTGEYTIPSSGLYRITGNLQSAAAATTVGHLTAQIIYIDGAIADILGGVRAEVTAASEKQTSGSAIIKANAGQKLSIRGYSDTPNTLTANSSIANYFTIEKLSGSPTISAQETIGALYTGAPPTGTLDNSYNLVTFGTKVKDSHGAYSGGVYTVPASGQYDIVAYAVINGTAASETESSRISIGINGTSVSYVGAAYRGGIVGSASTYPSLVVQGVPLKAGDTIRFMAYTALTSASYAAGGSENFFSITRSGGY